MEFYSNGFCRESNEERTLKVTLLGYKVIEEKTKFTVYKILVKRAPEESWHIFRRYTDFSRLHDKLKEVFPSFDFALPPKRWFKNFSAEFLEERQLGLQNFLQNLIVRKDVRNRTLKYIYILMSHFNGKNHEVTEKHCFLSTEVRQSENSFVWMTHPLLLKILERDGPSVRHWEAPTVAFKET